MRLSRLFILLLFGVLLLDSAFALGLGDRVRTTSITQVRLTAGGSLYGTQLTGARGIIVGGPTTAALSGTTTTYTWWQVNFDTSYDGWVMVSSIQQDTTPQYADLVPQNPTMSPASGEPGARLQLNFQVKNVGQLASLATTVEIRLSSSASAPVPGDPQIGSVNLNALAAGSQQFLAPSCLIPPGTSAGQKYIWIVVDPARLGNQGPATHNDRTGLLFTVFAPDKYADLVPQSLIPTPRAAAADTEVQVRFNVVNNGTSPSLASTAQIHLISPSGTQETLLGFVTINTLAIGARQAFSHTCRIPADATEGPGRLRVLVDPSRNARQGPNIGNDSLHANLTVTAGASTNPPAATPAITPPGGTFTLSSEVTLTCATLGASIRYTVDGTTPTATSPLFTAPFLLEHSATLKARAFASGYDASPVASAVFVIHRPVLTLENLDQAYDGTPRVVTVSGAPEDLVPTLTYDGALAAPVQAGRYTVVASLGSIRKTGTLLVRKKPLVVSTPSVSRLIGQPNPGSHELIYDGFVEGETEADLDTRPVARVKATPKSPQGDYPITLSGGLDNNYLYVPAHPPGYLTVLGFGGSYEALLVDDSETPVGKLTLAVATNAFSYSGSLNLADAPTTAPLKSDATRLLVPEDDASSASASIRVVALGSTYDLAFVVHADGEITGVLERDDAPFATLRDGSLVTVFPKGHTAPGAGAHTLLLHPPGPQIGSDSSRSIPSGSGHATATIAASTGILTVKGRVADDQPLTAALKPTPTGYHLWANPYGSRTASFIAGRLVPEPHPDASRFPGRVFIPAETGLLAWQKAALLESTPAAKRDRSHRAGFGPLGLPVSLDPWLPPSAKTTATIPAGTLAQRLGLASAPSVAAPFGLDYLPPVNAAFTEDQIDALPASLLLAANGKPTLPLPNPTKFALTITPGTGAFTGSFVLSDIIPPAIKPSTRKVTFSGTLRQAAGSSTIGSGFFLVPGLGPTDEQSSGEIRVILPE